MFRKHASGKYLGAVKNFGAKAEEGGQKKKIAAKVPKILGGYKKIWVLKGGRQNFDFQK